MSIQYINTGSSPNAGNGDSLRLAFTKINDNFTYLSTASFSSGGGENGYVGSQGINGYTGSVGNNGAVGYVGSQGISGSNGYIGSIGYVGSQGAIGPNIPATTSTLGSVIVGKNITVDNTGLINVDSPLYLGQTNLAGSYTDVAIQIDSSTNSYAQVVFQNHNSGDNASTDLVLMNSDGDDFTNIIDLGINSNSYNFPEYSVQSPGSGYLFTNGGDLTIGTQTPGKSLIFHAGGTSSTNATGSFNDLGWVFNRQVIVTTDYPGALVFETQNTNTSTGSSSLFSAINDNSGYINFGIRGTHYSDAVMGPSDTFIMPESDGTTLHIGTNQTIKFYSDHINYNNDGATLTLDRYDQSATFKGNINLNTGTYITFGDGTVQSTAWTSQAGNGSVIQSDTPPAPANTTTIWYDTIGGRSYVYFENTWVDSNPSSGGGGGGIGYTGSIGYAGSTGDIGYIGSAGYAGSTGAQGYDGSTGAQGYAGSIGYAGSQGTTGYIGSQGYAGSQGTTGYIGSQGYAGSQGTPGTSVRILGSTSTSAGLTPFDPMPVIGDGVITIDTGHLWVWDGSQFNDVGNVTGPQGVQGYTGSTGANGATGYIGSAGNGYIGSQGYVGSGAIGYTGSAGYTGSIGYTGSVGVGYVGSSGAGYTGSTGYLGSVGYTGSIGYIGSVGSFTGTTAQVVNITNITAATTTTNGALVVAGGVGIGGDVYVGGKIYGGNVVTTSSLGGGTTGQIAFQSSPNNTAFAGPGTAGQLLVSAGSTSTGPIFTDTGTIQVGYATTSGYAVLFNTSTLVTNAVTARYVSSITTSSIQVGYASNLLGNAVNSIAFQSANNVTSFSPNLTYDGTILSAGVVKVTSNTNSTSTTTGALIVNGGIGVTNNVYAGGSITAGSTSYIAGAQIITTATINSYVGSVNGYTGSGGYTGSIGYTGSQGYTGSIGYVGSTGAGYTGSVGYVGSAGVVNTLANGTYTITTLYVNTLTVTQVGAVNIQSGNDLNLKAAGNITTNAPFVLPSYTTAGLSGIASPVVGSMVFVTDATGGAQPCYYVGGHWYTVNGRTQVA